MGIVEEEDKAMSRPVCTILVAAYNAEKHIAKCLDSLLNQTLKDIEVIVIDDKSTDGTREIIARYAAGNRCVRPLFLSENRGQAHARNAGLQVAKGEYICFLDSDDWLAVDALQQAIYVLKSNLLTDCVLFNVINYYSETCQEAYPMPPFEMMTGQEAFEKSLSWSIHGVYMVRTDIHRRYPYDETCRSYSDDNTTRLHYLTSREVRFCKGKYFYRQHPESSTHKIGISRYDYLKANAHMKTMLEEMNCEERILNLYENERWLNVVGLYMFYFKYRSQLSQADNEYGLQEIKHAWKSIETRRLTCRNRVKFGYIPLRHPACWPLFRLQEEVYFTLRKLIGHL